MYAGTPTTFSGTFNMTTLSLGSALEGMGDANNGYHSASFERFCQSIPSFRDRVQAQYPEKSARVGAANPVDP